MKHLSIIIVCSVCLVLVQASISRSNSVSGRVIYASPSGVKSFGATRNRNNEKIVVPDVTSKNPAATSRPVSDGFNLLWLISSRFHETTGSGRYHSGTSHSRRLLRHGLPLHSLLPKRILRYQRLQRNRTVGLKKMISGKHIGFEMEFRVENTSGNGYLVTGRSLNGGKEVIKGVSGRPNRRRATREDLSSSWFGLFCRIERNQFALRLEYRNTALRSKKKFLVPLEYPGLYTGQWHRLTLQIDFEQNTIDYWVNCSHANSIHVGRNRSFPSTYFSVYRLLHHRYRAKMPVQVTFKSVVVTDGNRKGLPQQCFSISNASIHECSGGRVYMDCGPSCERTCESMLLSLHSCSSTCLRGCHCPPGQVYHNGRCISPQSCPCLIGAKRYPAGTNVTINNEICTCVTGKWKCFAVASFTTKPQNQTVLIGQAATLICGVKGNPLPRLSWKIPDGVKARIDYQPGRRKSRIHLTNVTVNHAGSYICQASRQIDDWAANASARISVTSAPTITSLPTTMTVTLGSPVASVDCKITGIPTPRAAWVKKGSKLRFFTVAPGVLRLKITNVNISHAGEYRCIAINSAGRAVRSVKLLVKLSAPNSLAFKKQPQDRCVKRGNNAVFPCQIIDHSPETNVTWFKDGQPIKLERKRIVKKKYKLVVRKVTKEDIGTYSCSVLGPNNDNPMRAAAKLMLKGRMLPWSPWTSCSKSCGNGWKQKRRKCTGIPQNQRTCHGKAVMRKRCTLQACPGICSSYGDPHYTTYDGRRFNFQGDCSYILSKDNVGSDFKIIQYNVGCGGRLSCVRKLTVILAYPSLSAVVDLGRDHTVLLNGAPLALPFFSSTGNLSIAQVGLYLMLRMGDNLEIRWATPHRLYVTISGKYQDRTLGLCGNFDGDAYNDYLSPRGRVINSDVEFGQSWAIKDGNINFSCSAVSTLHHPCSRDKATAARAKGACLLLLEKNRFGNCHTIVDPGPYLTSCMFDICSTSIQKTNLYFCIALSAYAEECLRNNVVLNWRTEDICPVTCTGGMIYLECGPNCLRYCPSKIKDESICLSNKRCVAGCYCPPNKVLHNGVCIPLSECPCVFNGMVFSNGSKHERNCQRCVCSSGKWHCVFNSMLCDYPASVARGPQSQVVPYGQSVLFCCGVTGIPMPSVQWYRNGKQVNINLEDGSNRSESHHESNSKLFLSNVSEIDLGLYTCKATNEHGSHHSNPASLTVVDPSSSSCDPNPSFNYVHLPEGCYVRSNGAAENVVNLGRCSGEPCYTSSNKKHKLSCNPTRYCCQPSTTAPVLVRCRHASYATSFLVTVVKQCSCVICSERITLVEGVVKAAGSGDPLKHFKISYHGRTVGYTSSAGSFRIRFPNLPAETKHVTVSVTDIMIKRFSTTIKNLMVLPGQTTLHTIIMHPCKLKIRFNASNGFQHVFRPPQGYRHRMRLVIPPESLIYGRRVAPYRGIVRAVISLIDQDRISHKHEQGQSLPGSSIAINLSGDEQLLSPSVILCVSLYARDNRLVDLLPGRYASLSMTSHGIVMKMKSWTLDDLTGYWRENGDPLEVVPHYTKRGEKALTATAKTKRLNTAWALGISQSPCYLRARVLDQQNHTVPAIKVSFIAANVREAPPLMNNKKSAPNSHKRPMRFSSYVEDLTSSRTYANGVCLPVGCHDTGMLHASRIGSDLVLLDPEMPPSVMGKVKNLRSMAGNNTTYEFSSKVVDTSVVYNTTNISSHYAYFHSTEECRNTSPTLQTYIFRDNTDVHDGSILSRYNYKSNYHNHVILTFGMPSQRQGMSRPLFKYCHVKVEIRLHPTFRYPSPLQLEVVTFRNKTVGRSPMTMLGWRHVAIRPLSQGASTVETQYACIEYLCGGIRLADNEQIVLHVNIRQKNGNNIVQTSERPKCRFALFPSSTRRKNLALDNAIDYKQREATEENFNRGGYVHIRKSFNVRSRSNRAAANRVISNEFGARTLADSKQRCIKSSKDENVSSYFECL